MIIPPQLAYLTIVNHRHFLRPHHHTFLHCIAICPLLEYARSILQVSPRSLVFGERRKRRGGVKAAKKRGVDEISGSGEIRGNG